METSIINDNHIARLQLRQQTLLEPDLEQTPIAGTLKRHGSNQLPLLKCRNPTHSIGTLARFEGMEALPYLTVAIRILLSVVNSRLIDVDQLSRGLGLQAFLKRLILEFIAFSIPVRLFFRLTPIFCIASLMFC